MAGNSQRRGAVRKGASRKGPSVGSGGQRRRGLEGKGPTPKASERPGSPAQKAARRAAAPARGRVAGQSPARRRDTSDIVVGRNPIVEALRANVPALRLHVATGIDYDDRVREILATAGDMGLPILEISRNEMDRITGVELHQGVALTVRPYEYADPAALLQRGGRNPLIIALDGVTDPRNLGAIVRSAGAFGAAGVLVPERRSADMTAVAWRTSAGAAARTPVAKAVNLTRALQAYKKAGCFVVGLAADGEAQLPELDVELARGPLVLVIGSEGKGLSRLVTETCDVIVSIPMVGGTESLNASVAASVALYAVAAARR
jgi:23S rRNA (guanosine2251-2'-O)-methyltransferase